MPSPVVILVGCPNTGKSTLFNRLIGSRKALVADVPGLTRDLRYDNFELSGQSITLVDTVGVPSIQTPLGQAAGKQTWQVIKKADLVLYIANARTGLNNHDLDTVSLLRKANQSILLVVNKIDGLDPNTAVSEFNELGMANPIAIAAIQRRGLIKLQDRMLARLVALGKLAPAPSKPPDDSEAAEEPQESDDSLRVALIGRPNVGKSTLINQLLQEERVLVSDEPGTTHDSVLIPFSRLNREYCLVDTAGIRRSRKIIRIEEAYSVAQSLESIKLATIVVLLIDASVGLVDQDLHLLGHIQHTGRPLVVAVNKWDAADQAQREQIKAQLDRKLQFARYVRKCFISALKGRGLSELFRAVNKVADLSRQSLSTAALTRVLMDKTEQHPPPLGARNRRIKLRYAHLGSQNPLMVVVHGTQVKSIPNSYKRFLENGFRDAFGLEGIPVRVEFRGSTNPYAGRKNTLTPSQIKSRKRLLKHVRKKD